MLTADENSLVMGLVWAHLQRNPQQILTWVEPYSRIQYKRNAPDDLIAVGGHYRRHKELGRAVHALACVCKFERLVTPARLHMPATPVKRRKRSDGTLIPRRSRVLEWQ